MGSMVLQNLSPLSSIHCKCNLLNSLHCCKSRSQVNKGTLARWLTFTHLSSRQKNLSNSHSSSRRSHLQVKGDRNWRNQRELWKINQDLIVSDRYLCPKRWRSNRGLDARTHSSRSFLIEWSPLLHSRGTEPRGKQQLHLIYTTHTNSRKRSLISGWGSFTNTDNIHPALHMSRIKHTHTHTQTLGWWWDD